VLPVFRPRLAAVLLVLPLLSACGGSGERFSGTAVRVLDGDLLTVDVEGHPVRVRLAEADCPERGQPFRDQARALTVALAEGQEVTVEVRGKDDLGYVIGLVRLKGGRSLDRELLAAGLAWAPDGWFSGGGSFRDAQQQARTARLGLWRDPAPVPPWKFRKTRSWRDAISLEEARP